MNKGLTILINHINSANSASQDMSLSDFAEHIRNGVITEPERFGELIRAYRNVLDKFRTDLKPEVRDQRTLENIADYVVMADHDYQTEMLHRASLGGPTSIGFYLENVGEYGPATKVLSKYYRLQGKNLRDFIFGKASLKSN